MTDMRSAAARSEVFMRNGHGLPRKPCPECGERFFTTVGLDEHIRVGVHGNTNLVVRWSTGRLSPAAAAARQEHGRQIAARNNARRRSCHGCGHVSTPAAIGSHQRASGHTGWTEVTP